jgi:hypothetical protein
MKVRKSAVTLWVLVLLGMITVSGCGPVTVETPVPTPDIAATAKAAAATAVASQPTPDATATYAAIATEIAATQTAQAEPTATPTPMPPTAALIPTCTERTIEAENCSEEGCRLEGFWKSWATPGASNGVLINNEINPGEAADTKLFLTFQGTGVIIVYRQDIWYGSLRVEIDDQVGSINQLGVVKDQAEVCFKVGDSGNHTLTLSGSKGEGVITVDAIRVLCGDAPC